MAAYGMHAVRPDIWDTIEDAMKTVNDWAMFLYKPSTPFGTTISNGGWECTKQPAVDDGPIDENTPVMLDFNVKFITVHDTGEYTMHNTIVRMGDIDE